MQGLQEPHSRMAYYYRRRWFPYRQRRRFWRRRRFYHQRTNRRRRYNRRWTVRRRRRRRLRRHRRRPRKNRVVVWNPPRVAKCVIRGWDIGIASASNVYSFPNENMVKLNERSYFTYAGGGVSVRTLGLQYFYQRNVFKQNTWSKSNEGFDLARYWGTKIRLYRHPNTSYIFWWDNEFGDVEQKDYTNMHPATLLLHRKHRVVMLSGEFGGKKKRTIYIPPPSTSESKWYSQESWCKVSVAKIGFTIVNFKTSFWHAGQHSFGVWIGFGGPSKKDINLNQPYSVGAMQDFTKPIMYRWYWDDGVNNAVLYNYQNNAFGSANLRSQIIDTPYYEYFWGRAPKGKLEMNYGGDRGNIDNPNIVGIYWYQDIAIQSLDGKKIIDRQITNPLDLPTQKQKIWVFLNPYDGTQLPNPPTGQTNRDKLPTTLSVGTILNALTSTSPFTAHNLDTQPANFVYPVNIPFFYSSYWQWGGEPWSPSDPKNPCPANATRADPEGVSISDPATVAISNLHPWDLDQQGVITRDGLSRILRSIFTTGSPSMLAPKRAQRGSQEKDDSGSPEQSDSSSNGELDTSGETTETEAEESPSQPKAATAAASRQLRRLQQQLDRDRYFRRRLRRKLKCYLTQ
ncbi:ORF1 [Torque teno arctocephalus australis virus]|nr:ORF1 [Torque teno arctocephalus australis virus]